MIIYFKKIIKCACCALLFSGEGQAFEESHEVSFDISQVKETSLPNSLTKKALEGDGEAAYEVGRMYLLGKEVPKNDQRAFWWFERGKKDGDIGAQIMVARCHIWGWGTNADPIEALKNLITPLNNKSSFAILTACSLLDTHPDIFISSKDARKTSTSLVLMLTKLLEEKNDPELAKECAEKLQSFLQKSKDKASIEATFANLTKKQAQRQVRQQQITRRGAPLSVLSKGIKKTSESMNYVYYSWKAEILNTTGKDLNMVAKLVIKDRNGYQVEYTYSSQTVIPAGDSKVISSQGMLEQHLWKPGNTIEVIPYER